MALALIPTEMGPLDTSQEARNVSFLGRSTPPDTKALALDGSK